MPTIKVREIAFSRSGDKGDVSNVHVVPFREADYDLLLEELTVDRVAEAYEGLVDGPIERYEFEGISAINFVMYGALDGGVIGRSLNMDIHGKSRGNIMVDIDVEVPIDFQLPTTPGEDDRRGRLHPERD